MSKEKEEIERLKQEVKKLKLENSQLKKAQIAFTEGRTVKVPAPMEPIFRKAEKTVGEYFKSVKLNPTKGSIEINDERYVLIRASALSHEFLNSVSLLYRDRGTEEALQIGRNILFDLAHVLGLEDAGAFHRKMNLKDPISKLSAGPVHFAYSGWAFVDILPESRPVPDENYYIKFNHPYSFEADSWVRSGKKSKHPVCIMNSGYSSGWCEASFGIHLTTVEISCRAKGDKNCTFIMAPPDKINDYLKSKKEVKQANYNIPAFLETKKTEEKIKSSLKEKEVLLKEIHHRVKNNLQIISSLLNLQADKIDDENSKEKYIESIGRIRSMAIIHELLYRSKNLSTIKIKDYLSELVSFISQTYNIRNTIKVELTVNIKNNNFDINKAIPCGIIINELLSNAFKYAFKGRKGGKICIELSHQHGHKNFFSLKVSDNGIGFPKKTDFNSPSTLGLQLVHSLAHQLDGKIEVENKEGSMFNISFPVD